LLLGRGSLNHLCNWSASQRTALYLQWPPIFNGGNPFVIATYSPGQVITFQLRAWSLNSASFESALADPFGSWGISPLGYTTLGGGAVPPGRLFGTNPGLLSTGFGIYGAVPEPSTWSLAALGAVAALVLRHRKRFNFR
jgi:hypothetical protein